MSTVASVAGAVADSSWVASFSEWNLATPEALGISYTEALDAMTSAQTRARVADERFAAAHCLALIVWKGWVQCARRGFGEQQRRARKHDRRASLGKAWKKWQRVRRSLHISLGHGLVAFEKRRGWDMFIDASKAPPTAKLISLLRRPKCVDVSTDAFWQQELQRCWPLNNVAAPIARWNTVFLDKHGHLFIGDAFSRHHIEKRLTLALEFLGCVVKTF